MKNWRERNFLRWDIFANSEDAPYAICVFMWVLVLILPVLVSLAVLPVFAGISVALLGIFIALFAPSAYKLHILYGIGHDAERYANRYLKCSPSERALYPSNIIETFRQWELLDYSQRNALKRSLDNLERQIADLRFVHAEAARKRIDITETVFELDRMAEHAKIEVDTYKELL